MRIGRNLLGRLRERSPDQLRRIAECWDVPLGGQTHAENVGRLYGALRDIWAIRDRAAALTPVEWLVVEGLLAGDDTVRTAPELAAAGAPSLDEVAAALDALEACGIVYRAPQTARLGEEPPAAYFLARELATGFERVREERLLGPALGVDAPLRALLTTLEPGELEEAAPIWGLRITPGVLDRAVLTDELLARIVLPDQRRAVVGGLPAAARQVFTALREAGGSLPVAAVREQLRLPAPAFRQAGHALGERLLVWHAYVDGERTLFIPHDVLAPRRPARDEPPPLTPVDALPADRPHHPFSAAWDLLTILRRLTLGTLEWREGDEERNATHARRLAPALWTTVAGRARPGYVPFLLALARDAGLVRLDDETAPTPTGEAWRNRTFLEQTRALCDRWRAMQGWPEGLSQDDLQLGGVDWPAMRQAVLEEVRTCRIGVWYDEAALAPRIARLRPALLGGSFTAARASGPAGTRDDVSTAAVTVALRGGLVPLGLLDEGATSAGRPALRLTELGGWLLGLRRDFAPPAVGDRALAVSPDFAILLFRPTPRRLWALGAIAEQVALDTVSTYQLTATAVRRGLGVGLTLDQIVTFLERGAGAPLPQNVRFTLHEWARGTARVRLGRALVLRPDDAAQSDRLREALVQAGFPAAETLPDGRLLLSLTEEADTDRVVEALRQAGFGLHWPRDSRLGR